jgi:hypothetical protein
MNGSYVVQRHPDRVSVSFTDEPGPDVDYIITVTFDNRVVEGQDDATIAMLARIRLVEFMRAKGM